jgi:2-polyprenyl-3-methyl-5-hydroxy-6-metoxy-1,4-benzoquinol methylase
MGSINRVAYQHNFSKLLGGAMYDEAARHNNARKILAIVSDYARGRHGEYTVLDLGCSTGIMTNYLASHFAMTVGVDIDEEAVRYATKQRRKSPAKAWYLGSDAMAPYLFGTTPSTPSCVLTCMNMCRMLSA